MIHSRAATLFLTLASFCASPLLAQERAMSLDYEIRPGDRVSTRLFTAGGIEVQVVEGERIVDPTGTVFMPFVGPIHVVGLNETSLRSLLRERYAEYYDTPVVDVRVELRVNVTGAVGRPGQYFVDPTSTIMDAMAAAGGIASEYAVTNIQVPADPTRVRLVRGGEVITLNLRPEEIRDDVLTMRVRSGDWLHVPSRQRSRIRDEITFWGSVISFLSAAIGLVILIGR